MKKLKYYQKPKGFYDNWFVGMDTLDGANDRDLPPVVGWILCVLVFGLLGVLLAW